MCSVTFPPPPSGWHMRRSPDNAAHTGWHHSTRLRTYALHHVPLTVKVFPLSCLLPPVPSWHALTYVTPIEHAMPLPICPTCFQAAHKSTNHTRRPYPSRRGRRKHLPATAAPSQQPRANLRQLTAPPGAVCRVRAHQSAISSVAPSAHRLRLPPLASMPHLPTACTCSGWQAHPLASQLYHQCAPTACT